MEVIIRVELYNENSLKEVQDNHNNTDKRVPSNSSNKQGIIFPNNKFLFHNTTDIFPYKYAILGLQKITKCNKIFINQNQLTRTVLPHYYKHIGAIFWCKSNVVFIFLGTDIPFEVDLK
jgi:hypothetical protein